ncbi:MAG: hypothetical protein [Caudoviricetes sp.]|nr:MAG: hypothetical protein [Caudoviricetes sp.]
MLNYLSNLLIRAYRARELRLAKQCDAQIKAAKILMDKAVSIRKQAGDASASSLIAGVTADRLEHLLQPKGVGEKASGKL